MIRVNISFTSRGCVITNIIIITIRGSEWQHLAATIINRRDAFDELLEMNMIAISMNRGQLQTAGISNSRNPVKKVEDILQGTQWQFHVLISASDDYKMNGEKALTCHGSGTQPSNYCLHCFFHFTYVGIIKTIQ